MNENRSLSGPKPVKANEYQCAMCKGIFKKARSDEEAEAEYQYFWPGNTDDRAIVCDDCWQKISPSDHPIELKLSNLLPL